MSSALHLRNALRDVLGPSVRVRGYRGTSPTWRKCNALGNVAVINVQASAYNNADDSRCVVNLGAAPRLWIEQEKTALRSVPLGKNGLSAHECMWYSRLHAQSSIDPEDEVWWSYHDAASAARVAHDIVAALEATWFDRLDELLTPDGVRRLASEGDPGFDQFENALAESAAFLPQAHHQDDHPTSRCGLHHTDVGRRNDRAPGGRTRSDLSARGA